MERINYLPIGSIVYLEGGQRKVMIISRGLMVRNGESTVFFDYSGVPYPRGLVDDKVVYFQHDTIVKVEFEGYKDSDDEIAVNIINKYLEDNPDIIRGSADNWVGNNE